MSGENNDLGTDIYALLQKASETKKKEEEEKRTELLKSLGVKEYFEDGSIKIDMKTCRGLECNLCVETCPTSALYWKVGEIGIITDLCVYCTACVFNCPVDNCIQLQRKRSNGKKEKFSSQRDVLRLLSNINSKKRCDRVKSIFPDAEAYFKRYTA